MKTIEALQNIVTQFEDPKSELPRTTFAMRASAAIRYLRVISQSSWDLVNETAEKCRFVRDRGFTTAYLENDQLGESWKGIRVPKAVLCLDVAYRMIEAHADGE